VYTFSKMYGARRFDPAKILAGRWLATLADDVTRQCVGGMQSYYPWSARDLFRPQFLEALRGRRLAEAYPEIYEIMAENNTGLSGHRIPALILQGTDDVVVHPASQAEFVDALRRSGSEVLYKVYKGSRHDTRQIAFYDVLEWIKERP